MNLETVQNRIGVQLPNDKLEEILYHSSYPQDSYLLERNKRYISWGNSIIRASYSLHLYLHNMVVSANELSIKNANEHRSIVKNIFNTYSLEEFVIKSKGELNQIHMDIVPKLIVLIFQQYGFLKVYDFLCPFFESKMIEHDIDYKTKLQEYAQAKKCSVIYDIVDVYGPDHEKRYTCKVTVANLEAIGEAIGKKKAEKEAAKQFITKYKIQITKKSTKTIKRKTWSISIERRQELSEIKDTMELVNSLISIQQLDEIFTHISYANQYHQGISDNSLISVVGDNVLTMLCCEYVFDKYDIVNFSIKKDQLLHENNLSRAISNEIVKHILRTNKNENEKDCIRLKIDIIKSIIGMAFVNYITKRDKDVLGFIKNYIHKTFDISAKEGIISDYTTVLQKAIQECKWGFSSEIKEERHNNDNSYLFSSNVCVRGADWIEKGIGFGKNKISAKNHAIKDLLPKLLLHCSNNQMIYAEISRVLNPELLIEYEQKSQVQDKRTNANKVTNTTFPKTPNFEKEPIKNESIPSEIVFDDVHHVLYICKGTNSCRKKEHSIVSATGILISLRGLPIKININYCIDCKLCFINLDEYKYYREKYGILLGNISIEKLSGDGGYGYGNLSNESILHMFGYTVNQTDNLSADNRRKILSYMMDRDIVSKYRIMEYLQFFINNSKYRYNMRIANQKWTDDLNWVRTYNIDTQKKYLITSIKKY